jgi:hypothetical protein
VNDAARVEADFEFTWDLLTAFFGQRRIQSGLEAIDKAGITAWEKWWQIELAIFLSNHPEVGDWNVEERFYTDRRTSIAKDSVAVDLSFRRTRHSKEAMIFLELKQGSDWKRCIGNMLFDAEKVFSAQRRSHKGAVVRSFFVVGVYPREPKARVHDHIEKCLDAREMDWNLMDTKFIAGTSYSFTMF